MSPAASDPWLPPDGGYGWVIVACTVVLNFMMSMMITLFGFLLVELIHHFQVAAGVLTWIGSLQFSIGPLFGVVIGAMIARYGCRSVAILGALTTAIGYFASAFISNIPLLYVTLGLIPGIGVGCMFGTSSVAVQQYFTKKRGFAASITSAGMSLGFFSTPPLIQFLISFYGWRGTLLIVSGIILHGCVVGALLRPPPTNPQHANADVTQHGDGKKAPPNKIIDFSVLNNVPFCLFLISTFLVLCGHLVPYMYMPIRCESLNIDGSKVSLLISIMGMTSGIARISFGLIADMKYFRTRRGALFAVLTTCTGVFLSFSVFLNGYTMLVIFAVGFGFCSGSYFGILMTVATDYLDYSTLAQGIGFVVVNVGASHLFSHPIIGWILDSTSNPLVVFGVFGLIETLGGCFAIASYVTHVRQNKNFSVPQLYTIEVKIDNALEENAKLNSDPADSIT